MVQFEPVKLRWVIIKYGNGFRIHDTNKNLFLNADKNYTKLIIINFSKKVNIVTLNIKITSYNIGSLPNLNLSFYKDKIFLFSFNKSLKPVIIKFKPAINKFKLLINNLNLIPKTFRLKY